MPFIDTIGGKRASLVLLHPTSLPDPKGSAYGVGGLGSEAFRFVNLLAESGTRAWQMLPLGHTGYGNSPYQTFSRFAGSPYMISVEKLLEVGDLAIHEHDAYSAKVVGDTLKRRVADFGWLFENKLGRSPKSEDAVLRRAFANFEARKKSDPRRKAFDTFRRDNGAWLADYAEYMAIKEKHGHKPWDDWEAPFRDADAWRGARKDILADDPTLAAGIRFYEYLQFVFFDQWGALRAHARERGVLIVGDIPWYVGYDSADVWARRSVFELDGDGVPTHLAGVPPDYFSPSGQLWGNPLYDWKNPEATAWWLESIGFILETVDILRLDHFRAIDTYWRVPREHALRDQSARDGHWAQGPGAALLEAIRGELEKRGRLGAGGELPIIAEDLGGLDPVYATPEGYPDDWAEGMRYALTADFSRKMHERDPELAHGQDAESGEYSPRRAIDALLEQFGIPWMGVLHFGFQGADRYMPGGLTPDSVLYTGTHDNDTTLGWFRETAEQERLEREERAEDARERGENPPDEGPDLLHRIARRLGDARGWHDAPELGEKDVPGALLEIAWHTVSSLVGAPLQDLMGLGSEARMNMPGDSSRAWWTWRATGDRIEACRPMEILRNLNEQADRNATEKE